MSNLKVDVDVDDWESNDWESNDVDLSEISSKLQKAKEEEETLTKKVAPKKVEEPEPEPVKAPRRNESAKLYNMYPYFLASVSNSTLNYLDTNIADLKNNFGTSITNEDIVYAIRTGYIVPLFYVLKSTKYYNPISKTRVPVAKNERVNRELYGVSESDQKKVYQLFGFSGKLPKKTTEDNQRDELLTKLKNIMYNENTLCDFVELIFKMWNIEFDEREIRSAIENIKSRKDYSYAQYILPRSWYYNSAWTPLKYVYGQSAFDNMGRDAEDGGQITREIAASLTKQSKYTGITK